ncbi:serine protease [Kitasatospora sp. NBC_00374]|uniref:S1 family peptidase n=1 Tax=Kitasatospora sp. NBC_00374 TaxID=2975964 RepID=UPI0030E21053
MPLRAGNGFLSRLGQLTCVTTAVVAFLLLASPSAQAVRGGDDARARSYVASLQTVRASDGGHFCGATLVTPQLLITAAHCVTGRRPTDVLVHLGAEYLATGGEDHLVDRIDIHPDFDPATYAHDLAVIGIRTRAAGASASIVTQAPGTGRLFVELLGWGRTCPWSSCRPSSHLQSIESRTVPASQCAGYLGSGDLCAANPEGWRGPCYGDSGGPALDPAGRLTGIISRGPGGINCGEAPFTLTAVGDHLPWLRSLGVT